MEILWDGRLLTVGVLCFSLVEIWLVVKYIMVFSHLIVYTFQIRWQHK